MKEYLSIANSSLMFLMCGLVVVFVIIQSVLFMRRAWQRGIELGISKEQMKKSILSSMIFSIIPTLPILIILLTLMPVLGNYFPWLRLSVVGSGVYENMAAGVAAQAFGLKSMSDPGFNSTVFISAMWVMTISIIWGALFTAFGLKSLDSQFKKVRDKKPILFGLIVNGMLIAMLGHFCAPYISNGVHALLQLLKGYPWFIKEAIIGRKELQALVALVVAAVFAIMFSTIAKKLNNRSISEFSFPVSMVLGMLAALLIQS